MGYSAFRPTGLTFHQPAGSVKGYTLVTPMNGHSTYLLDMEGRVVHEWRYPDFRAFYARLLPSGNLAMLAVDNAIPPPQPPEGRVPTWTETVRRIGGNATHLVELDWDAKVVWSYENHDMHHDFVRLENGNALVATFIELPSDVERADAVTYRIEQRPQVDATHLFAVGVDFHEVVRNHRRHEALSETSSDCPLDV